MEIKIFQNFLEASSSFLAFFLVYHDTYYHFTTAALASRKLCERLETVGVLR